MSSGLSRKVPAPATQLATPFALAAITLIAAAVRLGAAHSLWSLPNSYVLNADAMEYHRAALSLAGLVDTPLAEVFQLSPLTIAWGALWHFLLGPSPWAVVLPQILLGVGTVVLAWACARRLGGKVAAVIAGLLVALCEPLMIYDSAVLATSLAVFTSTLTLWACLRLAGRPDKRGILVLGVALGLAFACRPNFILFLPAPIFIAWKAFDTHKRLTRLAAVAALLLFTAMPVLPFTISNFVRGDVFVPATSSGGMNLFIGNNQGANGRYKPVFGADTAEEAFEAFREKAQEVTGRNMNPAEVSSFWTEQTWREIEDNPPRYMLLLGKKLLYMLNHHEVPDNLDQAFIEERRAFFALPFPGFALLFPLGVLGLLFLARSSVPGARATIWCAAVPFVTMLSFFVSARYRAPALPVLAAGAGIAVAHLARSLAAIRDRKYPEEQRRKFATKLAVSSVLVAGLVAVTMLPILHDDHEGEWRKLCMASDLAQDEKSRTECDSLKKSLGEKPRL